MQDVKNKIENIKKFIKSLNFFLNKNLISIISIKNKKFNFHARHSAKERSYVYLILIMRKFCCSELCPNGTLISELRNET